jgi:SAM-dependent methyltransferase
MTTDVTTSNTYVIERSEQECERLLRLADLYEEHVADACRRVGIRSGDRAIDVGCGAIGALVPLSKQVGPNGQLVGLDMNPDALVKANAILARMRVHNARLVQADINTAMSDDIPGAGSFDMAYCRLMLLHQPDPVATLRRVARLLRPGGTIVIQDCVLDGEIRVTDPHVAAMERSREIVRETMLRSGASPFLPSRLGEACSAAGLEEISQRAFFLGSGPRNAPAVLDVVIRSLTGLEKAGVSFGVATIEQLQQLRAELEVAKVINFRHFWGVLHNELIARVSI